MSKTAVQSRPGEARVKSRLRIQKPEMTVSSQPQPSGLTQPSLSFAYKFLLVSAYCLSVLTLCLIVSA